LLSIHQSKGLEFPVVAAADIAKGFNFADLRADILLDAEFGLCPKIVPPNINARYPSLPYWLARQRQKRELLGEELRLLYVAMTRARDRLLLIGSVSEKQFETRWQKDGETTSAASIHARSYADWLATWFANHCPGSAGVSPASPSGSSMEHGENEHCRWTLHDDASLIEETNGAENGAAKTIVRLSKSESERLRQKLSAKYPFTAAANEPAKTSVSALRRRAMESFEPEEAVEFFPPRFRVPKIAEGSTKSSAEVGTAYHKYLEQVSFDRLGGAGELRGEAERMIADGILSSEEAGWLDFNLLLKFWQSDVGKRILASRENVRRELPFTARFSPAELPAPSAIAKEMENEFVVVQGVADVAVMLPKEIWLLDFKTDRVTSSDLAAKTEIYKPQLDLYARALEKIYQKPVTQRWLHFLACGETVPVKNDE
jgi:ATP-dependent helicase/nuclease subunit A